MASKNTIKANDKLLASLRSMSLPLLSIFSALLVGAVVIFLMGLDPLKAYQNVHH